MEDNSLKNGMQVVKDLEDTVSWAINELGIKSEPNLYCVHVHDSNDSGPKNKNSLESFT